MMQPSHDQVGTRQSTSRLSARTYPPDRSEDRYSRSGRGLLNQERSDPLATETALPILVVRGFLDASR